MGSPHSPIPRGPQTSPGKQEGASILKHLVLIALKISPVTAQRLSVLHSGGRTQNAMRAESPLTALKGMTAKNAFIVALCCLIPSGMRGLCPFDL